MQFPIQVPCKKLNKTIEILSSEKETTNCEILFFSPPIPYTPIDFHFDATEKKLMTLVEKQLIWGMQMNYSKSQHYKVATLPADLVVKWLDYQRWSYCDKFVDRNHKFPINGFKEDIMFWTYCFSEEMPEIITPNWFEKTMNHYNSITKKTTTRIAKMTSLKFTYNTEIGDLLADFEFSCEVVNEGKRIGV